MRCVECGRQKDRAERGWVTVLSPSGALRIHYCPDCMEELVRRANAVEDSADRADDV
jgi:NAD-dependent SIR2 family protein deacetylase